MACSCGCTQARVFWQSQPIAIRVARVVRLPTIPVGELRGLIYRTSRTPGEEPKTYVHFFKDKLPMLATNSSGKRLYIIGGSYQVTNNGIHG